MRIRRHRNWLLLATAALAACGDPPDPMGDAGAPPDGSPPAVEVTPPSFVPCPAGWTEARGEDGAVWCEPWSEPTPAACTGIAGRFAGADTCEDLSACPSGDWQEAELPGGWGEAAARLYVRAGATGGDGTRAAPFGSIQAAVDRAPTDALVLVAAGTYDEVIRLNRPVRIWGACPRETRLTSSEPREGTGVVNFGTGYAAIGNVSIGPSPRPGILAAGAEVVAEVVNVSVLETETVGIFVTQEARLHAFNLIVAGTRSRPSDGWLGRGVDASYAADVTLEHAVLRGNRDTGLSAIDPGTVVTLLDVTIRDTSGRASDGWFGRGLVAEGGANVTGSEVVLLGNREVGLVANAGARISLDQLVVRETQPGVTAAALGRGVHVQGGATLRLSRVLAQGNTESSLSAFSPSELEITDAVVSDTRPRADGLYGRGVMVVNGATFDATRLAVHGSHEVGINVDSGSDATLTDVSVTDTRRSACSAADCPGFGVGVAVLGLSRLEIDRFRIARSALVGLQIGDPPPGPAATVTATEGLIDEATIGVNVQPAGYDFDAFLEGLRISGVERAIDAEQLPLPHVDLEGL